jgi:lysophospholipase L1-like esterase
MARGNMVLLVVTLLACNGGRTVAAEGEGAPGATTVGGAGGAPAARPSAPGQSASPAGTPAASGQNAPGQNAPGQIALGQVARYHRITPEVVAHLRGKAKLAQTRPCEIQVVGDSISETFLWVNPLTAEAGPADMRYADPTHCRVFGQPAIFFDVLQTAASGQMAGWGLNGADGWGGVVNLKYPMDYTDVDGGRSPIGKKKAYPEVATIMFGTNDIRFYVNDRYSWDKSAGGEAEARAQYVTALRGIVGWFLERGVVPMLFTFPPGSYPQYAQKLFGDDALGPRWNKAVLALGAEMKVPVVDLHQAFLDRPDWAQLLSDGVHINEKGYVEVVNPVFHGAYQDLRRLVLKR